MPSFVQEVTKKKEASKEATSTTSAYVRVKAAPKVVNNQEKEIEVIDLDSVDLDNTPTENEVQTNDAFNPQLVTSEVTVGNATYIVSMTLDLPGSSSSKSEISLKTNGLSIDATSQDGQKIDLMKAMQLQKVDSKDDGAATKMPNNANVSDA